ncbi:MAG: sigma 54-interacting transcriptional regulator [Deltaproteobacteria bacterium]|jgi:transcriptional regulator with GAF, ATPase, and Fis domain/tetratricopeptide (TPR) repeat protein
MVDVASPSAPTPLETTDAPRVRSQELDTLVDWYGADRGSVVLVHGRRGVGKVRLAEDLIKHAAQQPQSVILEGRTPSAGGRSFHPFAEIAKQAMTWAEQAGETDALIDPIYAALSPVLDHAAAEDEGPSLDQKLTFFDAFRRLLSGIASKARVLIVVHDLERADSDTLELTSYLSDELFGDPDLDPDATMRGLLVLLVRDDGMTKPIVRDFIGELSERRATKRLQLDGLDLEGLKSYVQSPHVLKKLLAASDGLPQEVDALIDALPSNVEELFERKLTAMDVVSRDALLALAVSGRTASARTLAAVTAHPVKSVAKALNELRESRVIDRKLHNGEFSFGFTRRGDLEVADRSLVDADRERFHGGWADALLREPEQGGTALLAYHRLRSDTPSEGVELAVQAAETYAVAGALNSALEMLESARPHADADTLPSILNRLAELAPLTGHPRRALRYVKALLDSLPEADRGVAYQREAALRNAAGEYDLALAAVEKARGVLGDDALEAAKIEASASEALYQLLRREEAAACCEAGLQHLDAVEGDAPVRTRIELLNQLGKIALADGDSDGALDYFEQTLAVAAKSGLASLHARALVNIGTVLIKRGEPRRAEPRLLEGIEIAREASDLTHLAFGYMAVGALAHQRGELASAIDCYRECRSLFRRLGNRTQLARMLHNLGSLYLLCGDANRAKAHNDEALRLAKQAGIERVVAIATVVDGRILGELGEYEDAEARVREGMLLQKKIGADRPLEAMVELAELKIQYGRFDEARDTLDEAAHALEEHDLPILAARAQLLRGLVELEAKNFGVAKAAFEGAREQFAEEGRQLFVRDAEIGLARALYHEGHRETARMHLATAKQITEDASKGLPDDVAKTFAASRPQQAVTRAEAELEGRPLPPLVRPQPKRAVAAPARQERPVEWQQKYGDIIGGSPKLLRVFHIIDRVASSEGTVLINGESGTGKELVAEAIHKNSPRADGPFVKLNCAALVESLLLSELFGHERGSFTGAHQRKIGRFEMAAGGTLFLDEIGDISPKTQVALLRVLQEREFERVGGGKPIKVEARIIFATNRNLAEMVREGTFREDLYYRLKGLTIDLPPLRERPADIGLLASHFLAQYAAESGVSERALSPEAQQLLMSYPWPGNIRELENIIRSVALFAEAPVITERDFDEYRELFRDGPALRTAEPVATPAPSEPAAPARAPAPTPAPVAPAAPAETVAPAPQPAARRGEALLAQIFDEGVPLPELKKRIQAQAIARALRMTEGNITRAAEVLGMRRPRLSQIINASEELKALCQGASR